MSIDTKYYLTVRQERFIKNDLLNYVSYKKSKLSKDRDEEFETLKNLYHELCIILDNKCYYKSDKKKLNTLRKFYMEYQNENR